MNQRLFSPKEIAQSLAVSEASIKRWVDKGLMKAEKTSGGHRKISLLSLQQYLKENNKVLVNPEVVDSGISAVRKSGKIDEAKDLFYKALIDCDGKVLRAVPYDLFLAGMNLESIFKDVLQKALIKWEKAYEDGNIDEFQFRRSEQRLQGVFYFLGGLLSLPDESGKYALVGALVGSQISFAHMEELILREQGWKTEFLGGDLNEEGYLRAVKLLKPNHLSLALRDPKKQTPQLIDLCQTEHIEVKFI